MLMMLKNYFLHRKFYWMGLLFVVFCTLFIMSLFFNKSVTLVEGWYTLYADLILKDGLVPYRDFALIVPPFALGVWTFIQGLFGSELIVFRITDVVIKVLLGVCAYNTFSKFFSVKIAALSALFFQAIFCTIGYDNGVPSYNEYTLFFMFWIIDAMLAVFLHLQRQGKISYKLLAWTGVLYSFAFVNKQTSGPLMIMMSVGILMWVIVRKKGWNEAVKSFGCLLASSIVTLLFLMSYFIYHAALWAYIQNVFLSHSAKGNLVDIFSRSIKILTSYSNVRSVLVGVLLFFGFYQLNRRNLLPSTRQHSFLSDERRSGVFFLLASIAVILLWKLSEWGLSADLAENKTPDFRLNSNITQLALVGTFAAFFVWLHYLFDFLISKTIKYQTVKKVTALGIMLASGYALSISYGFPNTYPYLAAFVFGLALTQQTALNRWKNIALLGCLMMTVFWCISLKLSTPSSFHGWRCGSVLGQLEQSNIPILKGLWLPVEEKNMLEDFYAKTHYYTSPQDTLLAFNNNQLFYALLERKPFTPYLSYYYDVSPDEQSLDTIARLEQEEPGTIVFMKFSEASAIFHEEAFRGGEISGQRVLGHYLEQLVASGRFVDVGSYYPRTVLKEGATVQQQKDYRAFQQAFDELAAWRVRVNYASGGVSSDYFERLQELQQVYLKSVAKVKKLLIKKDSFLEPGFSIRLLIRQDLYQAGEQRKEAAAARVPNKRIMEPKKITSKESRGKKQSNLAVHTNRS